MELLKKYRMAMILVTVLIVTGGWGFLVHKTVHQLAVYELPKEMMPFFYQNMDYIVTNAPRPDIRRNQDSTEAPKHFVDLGIYEKKGAPKMPMTWKAAVKLYSKDSLLKYGDLPYHIIYMKEKLAEAFKNRNKDSILFYATDIGHYIGDANVPLHTSENYDGQLTNQKGLHSLWESFIPEISIDKYNLYSTHKATYLKRPAAAVWIGIRRAAALVPVMLLKETEVSKDFTDDKKFRIQMRNGRESKSYTTDFAKAYAIALKNTINEQLLHSADMVADFWYTSWVDAGRPQLTGLLKDWSAETQAKLAAELHSFKDNKLIEDKLLISKKTTTRAAE